MLVYGRDRYYKSARLAIQSSLAKTDFDVVAVGERDKLKAIRRDSPRLRCVELEQLPRSNHRAEPFLLKFSALASCLNHTDAPFLIMLDTDTVVVETLSGPTVERALDGHALGMVEQTTITGSTMTRRDFLGHYNRHSLAWLAPEATPPPLEDFRYYNAGVVLGTRETLSNLARWAKDMILSSQGDHQVGAHMIADQDYFQFWANTLHPGSCTTLPWQWNHCQYWDMDFPRPGAKILHFSNFCKGPLRFQVFKVFLARMMLRLKSHGSL